MNIVKWTKRPKARVLFRSLSAWLVVAIATPAFGQFPAGSIGGQCSLCGRFVWGSYDSHDCPNLQSEAQTPQRSYLEPTQGDFSQPSHRPVVRTEAPSQWERNKELSRLTNNQGVDYLNQGDPIAAIRFFQLALEYSAENSEARANLQMANERVANQVARALEQLAMEAEWARQIEENNRQVMASITQQFKQAEDKRNRQELNRRLQAKKQRIDNILRGVSDDFDNRGGKLSSSSASDPGLDFMPSMEPDISLQGDPMVVDARHATSVSPTPSSHRPNPFRRTIRAPRNPRTSVLLDALEIGRGDWSESVAHLKDIIQKNPANTAARDAYHFTIGFSSGLNEREQRFPADTEIYSIPGDTGPQQNDAAKAAVREALIAVHRQDHEAAYRAFKTAHQADPTHGGIRELMNLNEGLAAAQMVDPSELSQAELMALMLEAIQYQFPLSLADN